MEKMKILVVNAGSSSIKYQLFDMDSKLSVASGIVERIGLEEGNIKHKTLKNGKEHRTVQNFHIPNHTVGLNRVAELLTDKEMGVISNPNEITAVGHRLVHGGETFTKTVKINSKVKAKIKELIPLAPLHNPANLTGVEVAEKVFPRAVQIGVFDTAFHQTMPEIAYRYAIPEELYEKMGIRKYGFHGTSHKYVAEKAAEYLQKDNLKIITIHLGNGASMAAVKNGKCIDTTMGLGPLAGLVMGTRTGDIDPSVIFYLANQGYSIEKISKILNKRSGIKGITGETDMRDLEDKYLKGDKKAILAYEIYAYRIKQYIGNHAAVMNGLDALVFTAGIGENDAIARKLACTNLSFLGIEIDEAENAKRSNKIREINSKKSAVKILVIPTNEELEIANQAFMLLTS